MGGRHSEAERLKRCREIFETALRDGISMAEARDRVAQEQWHAVEQRLAARCGTRAPAIASDDIGQQSKPWMMAE